MNQPNSLTTAIPKEEPRCLYYPVSETIFLYPTTRSFILESICLRLDLQNFIRLCLKLTLEKRKAHELSGSCPYCQTPGSFHLNKRSGESHCTACGRKQDLFTLINECSKQPSESINDALNWLSGYCKLQAEQAAAARVKSERRRLCE